ncbi:hypothetical protein [Caulobacter sp.]|uniref:hypothetical protein n=1 Tax=Caulobacter sp. TaxID=78 RepID=UPI00160A6B57
MRTLQKIGQDLPGCEVALTWREADDSFSEEIVTLPTAYAAAEAIALLVLIRPGGRTEAMVRQVLKTVPKAPRPGRG